MKKLPVFQRMPIAILFGLLEVAFSSVSAQDVQEMANAKIAPVLQPFVNSHVVVPSLLSEWFQFHVTLPTLGRLIVYALVCSENALPVATRDRPGLHLTLNLLAKNNCLRTARLPTKRCCAMSSRLLGFVFVALVFASQSMAMQVDAKLRKIDVEKRVPVIFANGRERVVPVADEAKVKNEQGNRIHRIDLDGTVSEFVTDAGKAHCVTVGAHGTLLTISEKSVKLMRYDASGNGSVVMDDIFGHSILARPDGSLYVTPWTKVSGTML